MKKYYSSHGLSKTPTYRSWDAMIGRCLRKKDQAYSRYGGRGIKIYKPWMRFKNFLADMGLRPSLGHSLERIDNNGNYSPSNCKWATRIEQEANKKSNCLVTHNGETLILAEWARRTGINKNTLQWRFRNGKTPEQILKGGD